MMLRECGWGIAIGNAMERSKAAASFVSRASNGAGVVEGLVWLRLIEG
jgi:hydroxymethylpyrimidine pyrophosphatase-like HAD family hydrolase